MPQNKGMTTPDEDIKAKLEETLAANAGVSSVEVDGQKIQFDTDALAKRDALARRIASQTASRPRFSQIYLGGGP